MGALSLWSAAASSCRFSLRGRIDDLPDLDSAALSESGSSALPHSKGLQRLAEEPVISGGVDDGGGAFAVRRIVWRPRRRGAGGDGSFVDRVDVVDPEMHGRVHGGVLAARV